MVVAVFVVVVVAGVVYCGSGQKKNANMHWVSVLWEHREAEKKGFGKSEVECPKIS